MVGTSRDRPTGDFYWIVEDLENVNVFETAGMARRAFDESVAHFDLANNGR